MLCILVGNCVEKVRTLENSVAHSGLYRGCPGLSRDSKNLLGSPCDDQSDMSRHVMIFV